MRANDAVGVRRARRTSSRKQLSRIASAAAVARVRLQLDGLETALLKRFGQPRLTVELVPLTCWSSNLRESISEAEWRQLRRMVGQAAGHRCEVCRRRGEDVWYNCHEVWAYDADARVQRLMRLMALCPPCHQSKHLGLARTRGLDAQARTYLASINGWTEKRASVYVKLCFKIWALRSQFAWTIDLSWLQARGVSIVAMR